MFTKQINGKLYGLIIIPNDTTQIAVSPDEEDGYVWLHCDSYIRKRVKFDIDEWRIIGPVGMLHDVKLYGIGLMNLRSFVNESGMTENNALLLIRESGSGIQE